MKTKNKITIKNIKTVTVVLICIKIICTFLSLCGPLGNLQISYTMHDLLLMFIIFTFMFTIAYSFGSYGNIPFFTGIAGLIIIPILWLTLLIPLIFCKTNTKKFKTIIITISVYILMNICDIVTLSISLFTTMPDKYLISSNIIKVAGILFSLLVICSLAVYLARYIGERKNK